MIRSKADEGHTARPVAAFCWPWSNPLDDGSLVPDVKAGAWQMPWNTKSDAGRLAEGKRANGDEFLELVKRTYRVRLTGGMKGCYVFFKDPATGDYMNSRSASVGRRE